MGDMISNANVYSAFLEGKVTKEAMRVVLEKMMRDSQLMLELNLAAEVNMVSVDEMEGCLGVRKRCMCYEKMINKW